METQIFSRGLDTILSILPELFNPHSLFAPLLKECANEIAEEDIAKEIEAPEVPLNEIVSEMNHKIASLRKRIV